jgi:hypothetical protein
MATVIAVGLDVAEDADVDDEAEEELETMLEELDETTKGEVDETDNLESDEVVVADTEVSAWELDCATTKPASPTRPIKTLILVKSGQIKSPGIQDEPSKEPHRGEKRMVAIE